MVLMLTAWARLNKNHSPCVKSPQNEDSTHDPSRLASRAHSGGGPRCAQGSNHISLVVQEMKKKSPELLVEVLSPGAPSPPLGVSLPTAAYLREAE